MRYMHFSCVFQVLISVNQFSKNRKTTT